MKRCIALLLALAVAAGPSFAQQRDKRGPGQGKSQGMSKDQRQRMGDDMREVFRDRNRQDRPPPRQLSPQEREQLRRDIQNANKDLPRK